MNGNGTDTATTIYLNGNVYTVDEARPRAEAFAVRDGRFVAVGTNEEIKAAAGPTVEVVDLAGRFVMPGIQDAHVHTQMVAEYEMNLAFDPHQPWDDLSNTIRDYARTNSERPWVFGGNLPWLTEEIGEFAGVEAHRTVLDRLVPDRPAAFWDIGGHAILANSRALAVLGIDRNTPDPVGGTIERDVNGEPTGVFRELATSLILEGMPPIAVQDYSDGLARTMATLNGVGITSINEVWTFPLVLKALRKLDQDNGLNMRVVSSIAHPVEFATAPAQAAAREAIANRASYEGRRLRPRYVKFVLDGSAGGQTLAMVDPYVGTDFTGNLRNDEATVMAEVSRLHGEGIGSVLHAVGDRAIRIALNAVEQAIKTHGDNGVRHVIAHTVFVNPADRERFAELGVIAEFSPYFWWPSDGLEIVRKDIGDERANWGFPVGILKEDGVRLSAGSDWPVVFDPNPFPALEAMVTREVPGGSDESYGVDYAISLEDAVRIFTMGSAYELYQEDDTGSIEAGKYADFIVLDRDIFAVDIRAVHQTKVLRTVLEGEVVFQREGEQQ